MTKKQFDRMLTRHPSLLGPIAEFRAIGGMEETSVWLADVLTRLTSECPRIRIQSLGTARPLDLESPLIPNQNRSRLEWLINYMYTSLFF